MEKMDPDQAENGSSEPTKSEQGKENEHQEISSSSSKKIERKLKGMGSQDSSLSKKNVKVQNIKEEKDVTMEKSQEEDPLDLSPENLKLAQKALSIELILAKILENLPTKSIVSFRLVNKTWEKEATNVIMKGLKIRLQFADEWITEIAKSQNLKKFNDCVKKSRRFPCSSFIFDQVPLDDPNLTEFFTLHGPEVKRLELDLRCLNLTELGDVLISQVPNVQELGVLGSLSRRNPTHLFLENSVLPHLKSLTYECFPLASEIIRVSPNLKRVLNKDSSLNVVETLASMRNIHLLKKISVEINYEKILPVELLAANNPKVEELSFYTPSFRPPQEPNEFLQRRFVNALSKIVECSKGTMTNLTLWLDRDLLMRVKWPRLEKVKNLNLRSNNEYIRIPPNFISHVFPNVQRLETSGEFVPWLLNFDTPLTHLEEFKLVEHKNTNLNNLAVFAPNLTKLRLSYVPNFPEIAHSLWACSGLKQLDIGLTAKSSSFPQVDMAFTGLSEEMVMKLHEDPEYFYDMKMNKKNISRPNLSILNCPDLTSLKIFIDASIRVHNLPLLMTAVTGEFGFIMLENLHVQILAKPSFSAFS